MTRHFCDLDGRTVHYRRAGQGPALVLLHASPVSSQVFERDYIPLFSQAFTCIAPDTPGNGQSDPLPNADTASIDDYADALGEFLLAIGVREAIVYGRHTGAEIALVFSQRFPDRTRAVYCDGYPAFESREADAPLERYLPAFEPDWAGSFLPWLWFRYRDQHAFWPWYAHDADHRSDCDVPSPAFVERGVLDFLLAGNDYIGPYRAAFRSAPNVDFRNTPSPTAFAIRPGDSLNRVQGRLSGLAGNAERMEVARETGHAVRTEFRWLLQFADGLEPPDAGAVTRISPDRATRLYLEGREARLSGTHVPNATAERTLLMLPHIPGGHRYLLPLARSLAADYRVLLVDPPGFGDSADAAEHRVEAYAEAVADVIDAVDNRFDIYAHGSGAPLAVALARRRGRGETVFVDQALGLDERDEPAIRALSELDFTPSWDGTHLLSLWHCLRDQTLWRPWDRRSYTCARLDTGHFDLDRHHAQFVDTLKQSKHFAAGWKAVLEHLSQPVPKGVRHCQWLLGRHNAEADLQTGAKDET